MRTQALNRAFYRLVEEEFFAIFVVIKDKDINVNITNMVLHIKRYKNRNNKTKEVKEKIKSYTDLEGEIWLPVTFNPNYKISNKGRILTTKNSIAKPFINNAGYYCIGLWSENRKHNVTVHMLVATHFLKEQKGYDIDHIDGNKLNNCVDNLRYVTHQYNCLLRDKKYRIKEVDKDGKFIQYFSSYADAARVLHFSKNTIAAALKNSTGIVKLNNYRYYKTVYLIKL